MSKQEKLPLYLQLMEALIIKIENNEYKEGEKLPSERELCEIYGLSRITVRSALQELEREGYIYKHHGKGTFVSVKNYEQTLKNLYSFTEEIKKLGKIPHTKVLSFKELPLDKRLADKMGLKNNEKVFQIKRLRLADDEPLMYETSYVPKNKFPYLTQNVLEERPMYDVFLEDYKINVTKAVEKFTATSLRKDEASYLNNEVDRPAMLIKRYAYHQEELIEYTISITSGGTFDYTVVLT